MVDSLTPSERSALMSRIGPGNTKPELIVRRLAHALGYRFRLHRKDLPGSPDLVFPSRHKVVFVHGCFWHRHPGCRRASMPNTHRDFWDAKFTRNVERDARKERELRQTGWDVLTIWECETRDVERLATILRDFLGPSKSVASTQ
ncbi:DNA mismatch endonuclease Vsr [Methylorubrum populi]|uniref:very short patch repair endonuclease n=1 Tax=Methylorubrum populi TaxID=223967 RepID=UPI00115195B1|nr:very short patch repair endonuclease [Methylorubrum populi]QDI79794.1 DNA mismatch endonuclease Vsr [Methylorubrum populi]